MSTITKVLKQAALIRDAQGNILKANLSSDAVVFADGKTLTEQKALDATANATAISTAINLLKDGGDGTSLPANRDNMKKIADALAATNTVIDGFINGGETDNDAMDTLLEIVTQINANKTTIDEILSGKVDMEDIVNDLTTGGADKVLSAEQGKALKTLIDALSDSLDAQIASIHTHENKTVLDTITANHVLATNKVVTEIPTEWPSDVRTDGVLYLVEAEADA